MIYGLHRDLGGRKIGLSSECLGHFWRAGVGNFWRAPKQMLHQTILCRAKAAFDAAFGLRRVRQDGADPQLPQGASQLRQPVCLALPLLAFPGSWRNREHRIPVRVNVHHPAILLQILPEHSHVLRRGIARDESPPTPARRVVDHPHQMAHRTAPFEPVVIGGVPLNKLAETRPPRPPNVHILNRSHLVFPQSRFDHPSTQGLFPDMDPMLFGQLFRGEGRAEIVPVRLLQDRQRLPLRLVGELAIGGPSTQPVDHHRIALLLHPLDQLAHPPRRHAHLLSGFALRHAARLNPLQPVQVISFPLAHRDSFHPSTLRLSRGTFYLAQSGTFYLAATSSSSSRPMNLWCDMKSGIAKSFGGFGSSRSLSARRLILISSSR